MSSLRALAASLLFVNSCLAAAQPVRVEGSASGYGISKAVAEGLDNKTSRAIRVGISGATLAFSNLCRGEADVLHVSRPISRTELEQCAKGGVEFIELPIALDALVIAVNVKNSFARALSMDDLRAVWGLKAQGRLTRWSQINPSWPDVPLLLVGPDRISGEADHLRAAFVAGGFVRGDYMASVDDSVIVRAVARDPNALGVLSMAYYLENTSRLRAVPISRAGGEAVIPSVENVARGAYDGLSRPILLYINVHALSRAETQDFAEFYIRNAGQFAKSQRYVPLTEATYRRALELLQGRTKGSVWDGAPPIGLTVQAMQTKYVR